MTSVSKKDLTLEEFNNIFNNLIGECRLERDIAKRLCKGKEKKDFDDELYNLMKNHILLIKELLETKIKDDPKDRHYQILKNYFNDVSISINSSCRYKRNEFSFGKPAYIKLVAVLYGEE